MQREERQAAFWGGWMLRDGRVNRSQQNFRGLRWDWDPGMLIRGWQREDVMEMGLLLHQTILLDKNCKKGKLICSFALLQLIVGCNDNENNPERKYMALLQTVRKQTCCVLRRKFVAHKRILVIKASFCFYPTFLYGLIKAAQSVIFKNNICAPWSLTLSAQNVSSYSQGPSLCI